MKHIMDYHREVEQAGGELRQGNYSDYHKLAPYYCIVNPHSGDEYASYFVRGLGKNPVKTPCGYQCTRVGCTWNVSDGFYNKYKTLFELVDKLVDEFPRIFAPIQPTHR